jgi:hypothetical protein
LIGRSIGHEHAMAHITSTPQPRTRSTNGFARALVVGGAALAAMLVVAALMLWAHYGTTVFFEMIAAGFAACF